MNDPLRPEKRGAEPYAFTPSERRNSTSEPALGAARDAAAERLDLLRSVRESAVDYAVITTDTEGRIVGWSPGAAATFGYAEPVAIGQPIAIIFTPDDRDAGVPSAEMIVSRERGVAQDNRWHMRADGSRLFVAVALRPIRNAAGDLTGYVKVCRHETDRRTAAEALSHVAAIVDSPQDAMISKSLNGVIRTWNVGAENEDEFKTRFGAHATRPVDRHTLEKFSSEHEAALEKYSEVLVTIVEIATNQHDPYPAGRREGEVTTAIGNLRSKYDMFSTELMTVSEFLTLVQSDRHEPIACGDLTADSAHWLAALAFSQTEKARQSCKSIAHRSKADSGYLYSTTATDLFYKTWIEPKKLPRPNDLASLMRCERVKALMVYDKRATLQESTSNVAKAVQPIHFDDLSGHQFERLVFAFPLRTEKWRTLGWYGQSGRDGGRDIWGERDDGKTVCTLCANWKALTASKIIGDFGQDRLRDKGIA